MRECISRRIYLKGVFLLCSEDGVFRLQKRLRVGKYVYKFVIDGEWVCDEGRVSPYNIY